MPVREREEVQEVLWVTRGKVTSSTSNNLGLACCQHAAEVHRDLVKLEPAPLE